MLRLLYEGDNGGSGGTPEGTPPAESTNIEKTGWLAAVSDDVFSEHKEELAKHTNISSVLKEHFSEKAKFAEAIIKPKEGATAEEKALYNERMGIPKDANGYQFDNLPEGTKDNPEFEAWYRGKALEMGLNADQGKKMFAAFKELETVGTKAQAEDLAKRAGEAEITMRAQYGSQYDTVMRKSGLVTALGGEGFVEYLNTSGVGSNPDFITAIGKIANMISEDSLTDKSGSGGGSTEKTLADRMYPDQNK